MDHFFIEKQLLAPVNEGWFFSPWSSQILDIYRPEFVLKYTFNCKL